MPNHVTTRCTITGPADEVARFRETMIRTDDKGGAMLDFNGAIPMPEILVGSSASSLPENGVHLIVGRAMRKHSFGLGGVDLGMGEIQFQRIRDAVSMPKQHAWEVADAYLMANPDCEAAGKQMMQAIVETGFASWYEWANECWGTKWGAYRFSEVSAEPFVIMFETAWSFPLPVFERLAEMFPVLTFDCACYDEGANFAGSGQFGADVTSPFAVGKATDALFVAVHGHAPDRDDEQDAA